MKRMFYDLKQCITSQVSSADPAFEKHFLYKKNPDDGS
jgi:hypothetical protein